MSEEDILNKYVELIDRGYCMNCNELNCIDNFPSAKIAHAIREFQQENQHLKEELKAMSKGLSKLSAKRKKWKNRFYNDELEIKQLKERIKTLKDAQLKQLNIIQQRDEVIDRAIKYIEKGTEYDEEHTYYDVDVDDILNILEILKEVK